MDTSSELGPLGPVEADEIEQGQVFRHDVGCSAALSVLSTDTCVCEVPIDLLDNDDQPTASEPTASSIIRHRETDTALLAAISRLPDRRRRIVELRHREGLDYAAIAKKLSITETAARKLWSRAIEQLRDSLVTLDSSTTDRD